MSQPYRAFLLLPVASLALAWVALAVAGESVAPSPYKAIPSSRQLAWHEMEFYAMIHFGLNTFNDKEWGYGDASPELFNPENLDAMKVVKTFKDAGMKGLVLVCKHHDGFCLWPSLLTDYSIKKSPWKSGRGDLVREFSEACRRNGLKFGVYLSPWDRNRSDYGRAEYLEYYRGQLSELLTNYGEIFMTWHDGANGGDGYYGGAREKRTINNRTYYDWPGTWAMVRRLRPDAVMFSDAGPDVRWVGNENGSAGDPCWCTLDLAGCYPGMPQYQGNVSGRRDGPDWVPAECDVSIRPGWFYHDRDDSHVKTSQQLVEIYYQSVGRGACLDLNVPLTKRGEIHESDLASLAGMRRILSSTFATNLASRAKLAPSNVRGNDRRFGAANVLDSDRNTYWSTDDTITTPDLELAFDKAVTFNVISIREFLPLGQRVDAFSLAIWQEGQWKELCRSTSIGNHRLIRTKTVTVEKVRLRIDKAAVCPAISELGLFLEPEGSRIKP